jgi:4-amino-4-deoxy-L-arabinose transferase-like glycosyltransferase
MLTIPEERPALLAGIAIAVVIGAGAILRATPMLGTDFPVNDGGLFSLMASELRESGFMMPAFTEYNGAFIPWTYPPLGLYLTALAGAIGLTTTDALRVLPFLLSTATIPVVYLIGRRLLGDWPSAALTAAFFAFSTGSYRWLVMGGGVTRALGFLLGLLAVYFAIRLYSEKRTWLAVLSGLALGATALSHPQAAVFGVISVPLLLPFTTRDLRRGLRGLGVVALTAAAVTIPWIAVVLAEHGLEPLLAAAGTGGPLFLGVVSLISGRTSGGYLEILGIATSVGLVVCAIRGHWLPVAWIVAIAIVDSRAGQPYIAVPAALAITFLVNDVRRVLGRTVAPTPRVRTAALALLAILLVGTFADSVASQSAPGSPLRSLSADARGAMEWVATETDPDASFAVVSGWHWALDAEAEWFPALTGRQSVTTVQGTEWTGRFEERVDRAVALPRCIVADDRDCVRRLIALSGHLDYLFLVDTPPAELAPELDGAFECCHQLADQLGGTFETTVVHRQGAVVIVRLDPIGEAAARPRAHGPHQLPPW